MRLHRCNFTPLTLFLAPLLLYFFSWFFFYSIGVNTLIIQSEDTVPAMLIPISIIRDGDAYLDEYYDFMVSRYPHPDDKRQVKGLVPFYVKKIGTHYLSAFPIFTPFLAVPLFLLPVLLNLQISWLNLAMLSKVFSALVLSLSGVLIYRTALKLSDSKKALVVWLVFLFATINFASISQAMWQHGTLELFVSASLLFLVSSHKNRRLLWLSGLCMGFGVLARPTAMLQLCLLAVFVLYWFGYRSLIRFLVPVLVPAAIYLAYNRAFYLGISNDGYSSQILDSWKTPLLNGFLGLWASPSKGILVYSPVFVFSIAGSMLIWKKTRNLQRAAGSEGLSFLAFSVIVLAHTLVVGMWKHWYGGWSFGYRMASDIIPYLVLLMIPYMKSSIYEKTKKWFYASIIWSVGIEIMGMAFFDGIWHAAYDRGFRDQSWLWSIANSEIVFNVKRILVEFGLMQPFI